MKSIRLFLLSLVALSVAFSLTSCNNDDELATYHIEAGNASDAYTTNSSLQALVTNLITDSDNIAVTYYGTHDNAVAWFNIQCDTMEGETFTSGVEVLDGTEITMELVNSNNGSVADTRVVVFFIEK